MKKTFIIATNKLDSQGDVLKLDGVKIKDKSKVLVQKDFDHSKPIGYASVENTGTELKATMDVPDEMLNAYPAIGFQLLKSHREGDIRFIDEMKLFCVSLCSSPNVDESIKPINEQL